MQSKLHDLHKKPAGNLRGKQACQMAIRAEKDRHSERDHGTKSIHRQGQTPKRIPSPTLFFALVH